MRTLALNISRLLWLLLAVYTFALASCSTAKKTTLQSIFTADTSSSTVKTERSEDRYRSHSIQVRDSLITVPGKYLAAKFTPAMLDLLFTKEGKPVPQKHIIDTNGLRLIITSMLDGSIRAECEADSYKILVQNLTTERDFYRMASTAKFDSTAVHQKQTQITWKEFTVKSRNWLSRNLGAVTSFLIIIILLLIPSKNKRK